MKPIRNPDKYAATALQRAVDEVASAGKGERNNTLNQAAVGLYGLAYGGAIDPATVDQALTEAARSTGLEQTSILATLRSARRAGQRNPRQVERATPSWQPQRAWTPSTPSPMPTPPPPPKVPPQAELVRLWADCLPLPYDLCDAPEEVTASLCWLRSKGLWPPDLARDDLCRVLSPTGELPPWAAYGRRSWRETGNVLLVPVWWPDGTIGSIRARQVYARVPKALPPQTGGGSALGRIMANPFALAILQGEATAPGKVVISEGETDFLTACVNWPGTPVFGHYSGGWSVEHAARILDGSMVLMLPDRDKAGDDYRDKIVATFTGRNVTLKRG